MKKTTTIHINDYNATIIDIRLAELNIELEFIKNAANTRAVYLDALQTELDSIAADLAKHKAELLNEKACLLDDLEIEDVA